MYMVYLPAELLPDASGRNIMEHRCSKARLDQLPDLPVAAAHARFFGACAPW